MKSLIISSLLFIGLSACQPSKNSNQNSIVGDSLVTNVITLDTLTQAQDTIIVIDSTSICLPYPNDDFFKLKRNYFKIDDTITNYSYDEVYWYLITNLDSIAPKHIIEKVMAYDEYEIITKWEQYFTNDAHYVRHEGVEGGMTTYIYTHCKNKSDFFKTIDPIIEFQELDSTYYNPEMSWNQDSTFYEPISGEAGCYYEIKKDSVENYMLEWYCGC